MNTIKNAIAKFGREEDGAQMIEYALIIAVISIALVLALQALAGPGAFTAFVARIVACLTTPVCV